MNPLAAIYRGVTAARNSLFDRGVLRSRRLNRPVVSVGNLSAGGAGKTPFVIALGELLQARGVPFDVLSRGYGRKTRGALIVDPDGSPADFGDEPLLIARRLRVPVIVGESRYEAGKLAEEKFETQLHILDDGFQHRSVARDFDIVLMTAHDFEDRLIPAGRLREPLSALARADAVAPSAATTAQNASGVVRKTRMANAARHRHPRRAPVTGRLLRDRPPRAVFRAGPRRRNLARRRNCFSRSPRLRTERHSVADRRSPQPLSRWLCNHSKRCY